MSIVKKHNVTRAWLNSAANANNLSAGDFYVVPWDGTYQATSGRTFIQVKDVVLPDFGSAAFENVDYFATASQGSKADSAIQQIKTVNGLSLLGSGNVNVVESGSNASGAYTRFVDGMQVCMLRRSVASRTYAAGETFSSGAWVFPAAFISAPHFVSASQTGAYSATIMASLEGIGSTQVNAVFLKSYYTSAEGSRTFAAEVCLFAVGRWKA